MAIVDLVLAWWGYTHLSAAELQRGLAIASAHSTNSSTSGATLSAFPAWKSWALTEIVYRDHDPLSKAFAVASFLPLVVIMFLSGLASAPCPPRRLPALTLLLYLILSVAVNVTCKACIRSRRPAHPAAGMNYTTIHGMPSDHSQFMAGLAVYLMRRWQANGPTLAVRDTGKKTEVGEKKHQPSNGKRSGGSGAAVGLRQPMPRPLAAFLVCAALFVGAGRVYNGYHTVGQVIVGWVVGAALALVCTTEVGQAVLTRVAEKVMLPLMLLCTYWTNAVC